MVLARPIKAAVQARVESISVISRQPEFYHGWPTAAVDRQGNILVVYSGGREAHVCPFGRVELIRSSDGGHTWSWPEVVLDTPIDDRDPGICVTPAGSLLVTTFTSLAYQNVLDHAKDWPAERLARWQSVNRRTSPQQRATLLDTWMLRSTDGGMTWSAAFRVPLNSPHGPVALSDGVFSTPESSYGKTHGKWASAIHMMMGKPGHGLPISPSGRRTRSRNIMSCTPSKLPAAS